MIDQKLRILSSEQIQTIHEKTLRVFDEAGIEVMHEDACQMWVDWGAKRASYYIKTRLLKKDTSIR